MSNFLKKLFGMQSAPELFDSDRQVVSDPTRCVQCGICGYNCPVNIPVRDYARQGKVVDSNCIQCGQCIEACPRGTLRWSTQLTELTLTDWLADLPEQPKP